MEQGWQGRAMDAFMGVEEEEAVKHCVGVQCFQHPHDAYVPPSFYTPMRGEPLPGRDFRWTAKLTVKGRPASPGVQAGSPRAGAGLGQSGAEPAGKNGAGCGAPGRAGSADALSCLGVAWEAENCNSSKQGQAEPLGGSPGALQTRIAVHRAVALPYCAGLGDDGRWRWQGPPLSFLVGAKLDCFLSRHKARAVQGGGWPAPDLSSLQLGVGLTPSARVLLMTPLLGNSLALKLSMDVLPRLRLNVRKKFRLGSAKMSLRGSIQAGSEGWGLSCPKWTLRLDLKPADSVEVRMQEGGTLAGEEAAGGARRAMEGGEGAGDVMRIKYTRGFKLTRDCRGVVAGHVDVPTVLSSSNPRGPLGLWPMRIALDSLRLAQFTNTRAKRDPPKTVRRYLRASSAIGRLETIAVVPGHWIDPGFEPGAPGEREFNLEVANALERQLRGTGWEVLRPDRDAPDLQWEGYLNWVSRQTMRGVPVIEIHGQGSTADYRGLVLGVIGDKDAPLSKELAAKFGLFAMDWKELAVPRRGGVIVESFNSDEVLQMAPWHRTWAVNRLATRIAGCVEKASAVNRAAAAALRQAGQLPQPGAGGAAQPATAVAPSPHSTSPPRPYNLQIPALWRDRTRGADGWQQPGRRGISHPFPLFQSLAGDKSGQDAAWPISLLLAWQKSQRWPFQRNDFSHKWPWMN